MFSVAQHIQQSLTVISVKSYEYIKLEAPPPDTEMYFKSNKS